MKRNRILGMRMAAVVVAALGWMGATTGAQTPVQRPPDPPDRVAFNKALAIKDLGQEIEAIVQYASDFPDSETVYFAAARAVRLIGEADKDDTTRLRAFVLRIEALMPRATMAYRQADVYYNMAVRLVNRGVLVDDAERLASKSVPLLNEQEFVAIERKTHQDRQGALAARTPGRAPDPFPLAEAVERFREIRANHLSALGRAYLLQGRRATADSTLQQSYALAPVMEACLALAEIRAQAGDDRAALDYAVTAALTGKMTGPERLRLEAIYSHSHGGSLDGLEAYLDRVYRERHPNPIAIAPYAPTPARARTDHVVMAELFTGAACIPCISVDLSFDAALQRYTREELALLVYHIHAPTSDPFSNQSVENRSHYYDVHAAPTVYLDGKVAPVGEGSAATAGPMFQKLDTLIQSHLEAAHQGGVSVTATLAGDVVHTSTTVTGTDPARSVRLQIALVESEASYSGENGLRFQPMVMRSLAGDGKATGFIVPSHPTRDDWSVTETYDFDLAKITAEAFDYYDWYIADLGKRTGIEATFREKHHVMDWARLSVVAFLQDDQTHEILQAAFRPLMPAGRPPPAVATATPAQPIRWSLAIEHPDRPVSAGSRLNASLTATLDADWHLYAPEQMEAGPLPTRVAVAADQPFSQAGIIESPQPRTEFDPNFNVSTMFFEGEVTFTVPLQVAGNATKGTHDLILTVSYQACSGTTCLPPRQERIRATVDIR